MNYQQWRPLDEAPYGVRVAVNTGGYIFRGTFWESPAGRYCVGPYGKTYYPEEIKTWSWSQTEPEQEMLMVKPHGIFAAHWWNEIGHLLNILETFDVATMVEVGILDGGLSSLLIDRARWSENFHYVGVDLPGQFENYTDKRVVENSRPRFQLFAADAHDETSVRNIVALALPGRGRRFFYCDGGDKAREAKLFWPYLLPGDLLGLHDYSDVPGAIGPEVFPNDIEEIINMGRRRGLESLAETRIFLTEKI